MAIDLKFKKVCMAFDLAISLLEIYSVELKALVCNILYISKCIIQHISYAKKPGKQVLIDRCMFE